ncbi:MAG TPA: YlcI/YnfO family protein [Intrasporangium sp.]|uniref:YlcI/YnfO family protein n=1 Tax=Intrasporangium sp. TaxID=1925024 RepID=UPI002F9321BE
MSKQIAVRLPEHMVEQIDTLVSDGAVPSRAALVQSALERELRRRIYEHEVETLLALKAAGKPDEFAELAEWGARRPRQEPELSVAITLAFDLG